MNEPLSRRRFLHVAAASAMAPVAAQAAVGQVGANKQKAKAPAVDKLEIKLAVKLGMLREKLSLRDKFMLLADLGFDGVELDSPNNFDCEEVLAARDQSKLQIPGTVDSVHWHNTLSNPRPEIRAKGLAGLRTALKDAHDYGGSSALLVPGVVRKNIRYDQVYTRSQTEIRKAIPYAKKLGVAIAIENVWNGFLLSPVEACRYLDEFDTDMVGMHFDVGNIVRYGFPEHWIYALGKRILKLDVKEYSKKRGFGVHLMEGDCDWPSVVKALKAIGYSGWATAEMRGGDRKCLASIHERMSKIFSM